jgi:hypothetical protein
MQRLGSATVARSDIGAGGDQDLGRWTPKGGCRHVQRRIALIEIVGDLGEEEVLGITSRCATFATAVANLGFANRRPDTSLKSAEITARTKSRKPAPMARAKCMSAGC